MSDMQEQTRHPIDKEFLDIKKKIVSLSSNLTGKEAELIKTWFAKLSGTSPKKRNEYILCLLDQVQSGKLGVPFTNLPEKYVDLPLLDEALLKHKYGTDRIGLHTCIKDIADIDEFTIQSLVGLAGPHTKDGGALLVDTMQNDLQEFRIAVQTFYDEHSSIMADQVAKEQNYMKEAYLSEAANIEQKRINLEKRVKTQDPEFDWNWFKHCNKVDPEKNNKLRRLKNQVVKQEDKNKRLRDIIIEMEQRVAAHNEDKFCGNDC